MKTSVILTIIATLASSALIGVLAEHDANDGCAAECQKIKGGKGLGVSSQICPGVTGNYCGDNCTCDNDGNMICKNTKKLQCTDAQVTKVCLEGMKKDWECMCMDMVAWSWGEPCKKGGKVFSS